MIDKRKEKRLAFEQKMADYEQKIKKKEQNLNFTNTSMSSLSKQKIIQFIEPSERIEETSISK